MAIGRRAPIWYVRATQNEAQANPLIKFRMLYFFAGMPAVAHTKGIVIRKPAAKRESRTATVLWRSTNRLTFGYHLLSRFDFLIARAARSWAA